MLSGMDDDAVKAQLTRYVLFMRIRRMGGDGFDYKDVKRGTHREVWAEYYALTYDTELPEGVDYHVREVDEHDNERFLEDNWFDGPQEDDTNE